jgi:hypothetical protein
MPLDYSKFDFSDSDEDDSDAGNSSTGKYRTGFDSTSVSSFRREDVQKSSNNPTADVDPVAMSKALVGACVVVEFCMRYILLVDIVGRYYCNTCAAHCIIL